MAWEHASCKRMLAVLDNAGSADQVPPLPPGIPAFAEARTAGCFRLAWWPGTALRDLEPTTSAGGRGCALVERGDLGPDARLCQVADL